MLKRVLSLLLFIVAITFGTYSQVVEITNNVAGNLEQAIKDKGVNPSEVTSLTVSGNINGTDIVLIRAMGGTDINNEIIENAALEILNLADANIVEGGSHYVENPTSKIKYYTANNEIGVAMFYGCSFKELTIPKSITLLNSDGYNFYDMTKMEKIVLNDNIKAIPLSAFEDCQSLKTITLPSALTSIGKEAFRLCVDLTSVVIPNTTTDVGDHCFFGCKNLKEVTWNPNYRSFSTEIFADCKELTTIKNFPTELDFLGNNAFADCIALEGITLNISKDCQLGELPLYNTKFDDIIVNPENAEYCSENGILYNKDKSVLLYGTSKAVAKDLIIPSSVNEIDAFAFYYGELNSIDIPSSVKILGMSAFLGNTLEKVNGGSNITEIGETCFSQCPNLSSFVVPAGVKIIQKGTFLNAFALSSITLNEGLEEIYGSAFYFTTISKLYIPASVTNLVGGALFGMGLLSEITISPDNSNYTCIDNAIYTKNKSSLYYVSSSRPNSEFVVDKDCNFIMENTFFSNSSVKKLSFANPKTEFGSCIIMESRVETIDTPAELEKISYGSLSGSDMTKCILHDNLKEIGNQAFYRSHKLAEIEIPKSVTFIGDEAFAECPMLSVVKCYATSVPELQSNVFFNIPKDKLYVPQGCKSAYQAADQWNEFSEIIEMQSSVNDIESSKTEIIATDNSINITTSEPTFIEIFNINGKTIMSNIISNSTSISLPSGIYLVKTPQGTEKVIIK